MPIVAAVGGVLVIAKSAATNGISKSAIIKTDNFILFPPHPGFYPKETIFGLDYKKVSFKFNTKLAFLQIPNRLSLNSQCHTQI